MVTLTETTHANEGLISEANNERSREAVTVISGEDLGSMAVIGVITASGKVTELAPAAGDGSEAAAGVMYDAVDASSADAPGVIYARDCELSADLIAWPSGITAPQQAAATAELKALGIILR